MSPGLHYDEAASRRLEAIYVTADVVAQRQAVLRAVGINAGERVLDLGAGPGFLVAELAEIVGPSGAVYGVDISESMVEMARRRCNGLPTVTVEIGDAHDLPYRDDLFDVCISTQVLEYVADPPRVLKQLHRVVRPGARIGVLATDWSSLVWHGPDAELMSRVLRAWTEHCADPHLPRTLGRRLSDAGFEITGRSIIPLYNPADHSGTYSGGLIDLITDFVAGRSELTDEDVHAWASGLRTLSEHQEYFFSLNRYLFTARKPDDAR